MILADVIVLLYTFRTDAPEHPQHKICLEQIVLEKTANDGRPYGMSPQILASVIRVIEPGPRHWNIFADLCRTAGVKGNLVQDAWFAALAMESGCEWITHDRDYARFTRLRWRAPF